MLSGVHRGRKAVDSFPSFVPFELFFLGCRFVNEQQNTPNGNGERREERRRRIQKKRDDEKAEAMDGWQKVCVWAWGDRVTRQKRNNNTILKAGLAHNAIIIINNQKYEGRTKGKGNGEIVLLFYSWILIVYSCCRC